VLGVGALGLAALVLFLRLSVPPAGVTPENFWRIRPGMSMKDVEALLGPKANPIPIGWSWVGPTYHAAILFDKDGKARVGGIMRKDGTGQHWHLRDQPTLLDRLRCLLPW
jgi:hypothetical protein